MAELAEQLGKRLHRPQAELRSLRIGGVLHDLGKIAIKDEILNKNGPLDAEQGKLDPHLVGEFIAMLKEQRLTTDNNQ